MDFHVIIIGTGFGASVAATTLAGRNKKVLMLERGVWFFTPEGALPDWLQKQNQDNPTNQPVQYWPRPDNSLGIADFLTMVRANATLGWLQKTLNKIGSSFTSRPEPQPLYRYNMFPEIHILTASGVGGGSLIYSNVTLEPLFDGQKYPVMQGWPLQLTPQDYDAARIWMDKNRGKRSKVVTRVPVPPGCDAEDRQPKPPGGGPPSHSIPPPWKKLRAASWGKESARPMEEQDGRPVGAAGSGRLRLRRGPAIG